MKRNWNAPIWIGFVVLVMGLFSYPFLFRFPATRDFPWNSKSRAVRSTSQSSVSTSCQ